MPKDDKKNLKWTVFSGVFVLFLLLVMIYAGNIAVLSVDNQALRQLVQFLNINKVLLLSIALVFFAGEIFSSFDYPYNLPSPLLNAFGSVLSLSLILKVFEYLNHVIKADVFTIPDRFAIYIYMFVFIGVLLLGYVSIFARKKRAKQAPAAYKEDK